MCNGMCGILRTHDGRRGMVCNLDCGRWKCDECGADIRQKWLERASFALSLGGIWQVSVCNEKQFDALTRRLRKQDRAYYRIRIGNISHVFHQPLFKTKRYTPDPAKWINAQTAIQQFELLVFREDACRVSYSKHFAESPPEKTPSKWTLEGIKKGGVKAINHQLKKVGIKPVSMLISYDGRINDAILFHGFWDLRIPFDPRLHVKQPDTVEGRSKARISRTQSTPITTILAPESRPQTPAIVNQTS